MKNIIKYILLGHLLLTIFHLPSFGQTIPDGISTDTLVIPNTYDHEVAFYKPMGYDSINGAIWWAVHGLGGNGASMVNQIKDIADRRKALIIAPTMHKNWSIGAESYYDGCYQANWYTLIFKEMYKYILERENRDSIPVYLSGFSAGGQLVTRYMLIRQAVPDSIPIMNAISINPFYYTFCTDSLNGIDMPYACGLSATSLLAMCGEYQSIDFICNEHVEQYYNENYHVLIGTADTIFQSSFPCYDAQGRNRYERAKNFYNFSDTNAVTRGTTLQWQYAEVPGVGHDGYAMYHTKAKPTDSSSIAETLLFDTPWHPVPNFLPKAKFSHSDTALSVSFTDNSANTTTWNWDFGDGDSSLLQNPIHAYSASGTYTVCLTVGDTCASDTYCDTVSVISTGVGMAQVSGLKFQVVPNPFSETTTFTFSGANHSVYRFVLRDVLGREVKVIKDITTASFQINKGSMPAGIYFYQIESKEQLVGSGKLVVQ